MKKKPEIVLRQRKLTLRLLPSGPDLVRKPPFHKVPGSHYYTQNLFLRARFKYLLRGEDSYAVLTQDRFEQF